MKKVLFIVESPTPYRIAVLRELAKKCELSVFFTYRKDQHLRPEKWYDYNFEGFKVFDIKGHIGPLNLGLISAIKEKYDIIFSCDYSSVTGFILSLIITFTKRRYAMEADGAKHKSNRGIKEIIKHFIVSHAFICFSSSSGTDEYYRYYGAENFKIIRYPFTSLFKSDIVNRPIKKSEKQRIRAKLNLKESRIIISVGRFSYQNGYGKGFDTLLSLAKITKDIGYYIIGDEPTEKFIEIKKQSNLNNVHFLSHKNKNELFEYYKAADLSVLLSRGEAWGLVINESMANGTPVIATDACVGALEIINNKENGYIVPVNSPEHVKECIQGFFSSYDTQENMSVSAIETIKNYTIENMVKIHIDVLNNL